MKFLVGAKDFDRNPKVRKFVITGCGRSGTMYMTKVFNVLGFKVGHEGFFKNGISSWFIAEKSHADYVKNLLKGHKVTYIHIIRNPIDVINSMYRCELLKNRTALDFVRDYYDVFKNARRNIHTVIRWWMFWNMEIINNFPISITLPIEQLQYPDSVFQFCRTTGITYTPEIFQNIKKIGTSVHTLYGREKHSLKKTYGEKVFKDFTFEELVSKGYKTAQLLRDFAFKFGYEL